MLSLVDFKLAFFKSELLYGKLPWFEKDALSKNFIASGFWSGFCPSIDSDYDKFDFQMFRLNYLGSFWLNGKFIPHS